MIHFLVHGKDDNVAVAVAEVSKGQRGKGLNMSTKKDFEIQVLTDMPLGHKIALKDLKVDDTIVKYDHDIGRVGVRNHVLVLPLDDISNTACEAVASHIRGTLAVPHAYGRLQFGEDLELTFRTIIGAGCNPNMAAVVVIGIEPGWADRVAQGIKKTGKPVSGFSIEGNGDLRTGDLADSHPTKGNIAGGLTTIEEKALGIIQKIANLAYDGVLEPAEAPGGPGLWFMDTSSAAAEALGHGEFVITKLYRSA